VPDVLIGGAGLTGIEPKRERILVGTDAKIGALVKRLPPINYWRFLGRRMPS